MYNALVESIQVDGRGLHGGHSTVLHDRLQVNTRLWANWHVMHTEATINFVFALLILLLLLLFSNAIFLFILLFFKGVCVCVIVCVMGGCMRWGGGGVRGDVATRQHDHSRPTRNYSGHLINITFYGSLVFIEGDWTRRLRSPLAEVSNLLTSGAQCALAL